MAIALITLLLENLLQLTWNKHYFPFGIPLFNVRLAASPERRARLALGSLERDLYTDT